MRDEVVQLLFFALLLAVNQYCCRWIFAAVCRSAGMGPEQVVAYRKHLHLTERPYFHVSSRLITFSPDPAKTRRWLFLYQMNHVLLLFGMFFAVVGCMTRTFGWVLGLVGAVLAAFTAILTVAGVVYGRPRPARAADTAADRPPHGAKKVRRQYVDAAAKLVCAAGILGLALFMLGEMAPKTPPTAEQVRAALTAQGYAPQEMGADELADYPGLTRYISAGDGQLQFSVYIFDDPGAARDTYERAHQRIVSQWMQSPFTDTVTQRSNYAVYTLQAGDMYAVAAYIGQTVVYGYCDLDHKEQLVRLLQEIGYMDAA